MKAPKIFANEKYFQKSHFSKPLTSKFLKARKSPKPFWGDLNEVDPPKIHHFCNVHQNKIDI